jgi:hypothetical protein
MRLVRCLPALLCLLTALPTSAFAEEHADLELQFFGPTIVYEGELSWATFGFENLDGVEATGTRIDLTITGDVQVWGAGVGRPGSCEVAPEERLGRIDISCTLSMPMPVGFFGRGFIDYLPLSVGSVTIRGTIEASEEDPNPANNSFEQEIVVIERVGADLNVWVEGPWLAPVDEPADVSVIVVNTGPETAVATRLALRVEGDVDWLGVFAFEWCTPMEPECDKGGRLVELACAPTAEGVLCDLGDVEPWAFNLYRVVVLPNRAGVIEVEATVASETLDPDPTGNTAWAFFEAVVVAYADLALAVSDSPDPVHRNHVVTYAIEVTNHGPDTSSSPSLAGFVPFEVELVGVGSSQGWCEADRGFMWCSLGALAAGETAFVTLQLMPSNGGTLVASFNVWGGSPVEIDPDWENNSVVETTTVRGPASPDVVQQERFEIELPVFIPCADDFVVLEGTLHLLFQTNVNVNTGAAQFRSLAHPANLSGEGLVSGRTYHGTGGTMSSERWRDGLPQRFSFVNNFRIIGQGSGNNYLVQMISHVFFDADGNLRLEVDRESFECR